MMEHNRKETSLHLAVKSGNTEAINIALQNGEDINAQDCDGNTPLHLLIDRSYLQDEDLRRVTKLLLERGADVRVMNNKQQTPLYLATRDNLDCASILIQNVSGKEAINIPNVCGFFPIHHAVSSNNVNLLNLLLDNGASSMSRSDRGCTPLHMTWRCDGSCIMVLLERGAQINARNDRGQTPLHIAVENNHCTKVSFLLQMGAEVNLQDRFGLTPLHCVSSFSMIFGDTLIPNTLLDWGASLDIRDTYGRTPSDIYPKFIVCADQHIVRRACVNLSRPLNMEMILESYQSYHSSCLEEVNRLKLEQCGQNSLYDIFGQYSDPKFLLNNKLKETVNLYNLNEHYPIYSSLLKLTYKKAKERVDLLKAAADKLPTLLPREVTWYILTFVDEESLKNVLKA